MTTAINKSQTTEESNYFTFLTNESISRDFPTDAADRVREAVFNTASQVTQDIFKTTTKVAALVEDLAENTATETQKLIERTTDRTGRTLKLIAKIPLLKSISNVFGLKWLTAILGEVDVEQAKATVSQLQLQYPQETPSQIAHRLMVKKAWEAGQIGLLTNIIPPIAAALLGIELVAMTKLQAEMVYQIAAVYGLDLHEPARRGEVLAIFALSLGGGFLKTGLSFVEIIPGVGAAVGASANAAMLYALGYTACRFYETKNQSFSEEATIEALQKESQNYWQSALVQSRRVDQVLVHMILASYPDKSWSDILRALKAVSPSSVKVVATHLEKPQPLDRLLEQLSPDFAMLLLGRCYRIAQLDGVITPEEQKVLDAIAEKFEIDLTTVENPLTNQLGQ